MNPLLSQAIETEKANLAQLVASEYSGSAIVDSLVSLYQMDEENFESYLATVPDSIVRSLPYDHIRKRNERLQERIDLAEQELHRLIKQANATYQSHILEIEYVAKPLRLINQSRIQSLINQSDE